MADMLLGLAVDASWTNVASGSSFPFPGMARQGRLPEVEPRNFLGKLTSGGGIPVDLGQGRG